MLKRATKPVEPMTKEESRDVASVVPLVLPRFARPEGHFKLA